MLHEEAPVSPLPSPHYLAGVIDENGERYDRWQPQWFVTRERRQEAVLAGAQQGPLGNSFPLDTQIDDTLPDPVYDRPNDDVWREWADEQLSFMHSVADGIGGLDRISSSLRGHMLPSHDGVLTGPQELPPVYQEAAPSPEAIRTNQQLANTGIAVRSLRERYADLTFQTLEAMRELAGSLPGVRQNTRDE